MDLCILLGDNCNGACQYRHMEYKTYGVRNNNCGLVTLDYNIETSYVMIIVLKHDISEIETKSHKTPINYLYSFISLRLS